MDIRVTEEFEIRSTDSLNWQVFELRDVAKKDGTKSTEWVAHAAYFSDIDGALRWVMRYLPKKRRKGTLTTLTDALSAIQGISKEIGRSARKFEKAMKGE